MPGVQAFEAFQAALPEGFTLFASKFMDDFEFMWLMGDELPGNAAQFLFLPDEMRSYYIQIKKDYIWSFQLDEERAFRMFKVTGHLQGNVYKPHSRAEARYVTYGQLDGCTLKAGLFINHSGVKRALFMYLEKPPDRWGSQNMQKLHMIKAEKVPQNVDSSVSVWFGGRDEGSPPPPGLERQGQQPGWAPGVQGIPPQQWLPRSRSRVPSDRRQPQAQDQWEADWQA